MRGRRVRGNATEVAAETTPSPPSRPLRGPNGNPSHDRRGACVAESRQTDLRARTMWEDRRDAAEDHRARVVLRGGRLLRGPVDAGGPRGDHARARRPRAL